MARGIARLDSAEQGVVGRTGGRMYGLYAGGSSCFTNCSWWASSASGISSAHSVGSPLTCSVSWLTANSPATKTAWRCCGTVSKGLLFLRLGERTGIAGSS